MMDEIGDILPIDVDVFRKGLWPRRLYLWFKELHPRAGGIFITFWMVLWFLIAVAINLALLIIIIASILFILKAMAESDGDTYYRRRYHSHGLLLHRPKNNKSNTRANKKKKEKIEYDEEIDPETGTWVKVDKRGVKIE